MSRIRWYGPSVVLLITVIVCLIVGPQLMRNIAWARTDTKIDLIRNQLTTNQTLESLDSAFTDVARTVEPSVVYIEIYAKHPPMANNPLQRFFGPGGPFQNPDNPFNPNDGNGNNNGNGNGNNGQNNMQQYNQPQPIGSGSGWVFDDKGDIITNNHVVAHADKLVVKFHDGTKEVATVVGQDPDTDIAVIHVNRKDLHPAQVATKPVHQGDIVFAFGSPFEFQFSMSMGIVSAKGRQLGIIQVPGKNGPQRGYENYIQTDAAINPGNSGGPLTNIYGQVIGMNSAIASKNGQNNGLGFAIPVGMVVNVAKQLISSPTHSVKRGYMGVYIRDLTPKLAQTFGFQGQGVLVENPIPDSPAAKAGLEAGDIITKVNGKPVASSHDLRFLVAGLNPGTPVHITVFRSGKTLPPITLTLGTLPGAAAQGSGSSSPTTQVPSSNKGLTALRQWGISSMTTFTQTMANQLSVSFHAGVLVKAVRDSSIAESVGITRGTIITAVQGHKVTSVGELTQALQKYDLQKKPVRLRILHYIPASKTFMPFYVVMDLSEIK